MTAHEELLATIRRWDTWLRAGLDVHVDTELATTDFNDRDPAVILGMLRLIFTARDRLPSWRPAVAKARVALLAKALDADVLLAGLE